MAIEHGIVVGGVVLPGTERVLRRPDAWWSEPSTDLYPRRGYTIDRICAHWSGGHHRTGPDAGLKLYRAMAGRKRDDGTDMDVSCHFGIAWDGGIHQLADLASATIHVTRKVNLRSIGVEHMWSGLHTQAAKLGIPPAEPVRGYARGGAVKCYPPSSEMLEAWRWLVRELTSADHPLLVIPMRRGSETAPGILEHMDISGSRKLDGAGLLVGALGLR